MEKIKINRVEARSIFRQRKTFFIKGSTFDGFKIIVPDRKEDVATHSFHFYIKNLLKMYNCKRFTYYRYTTIHIK